MTAIWFSFKNQYYFTQFTDTAMVCAWCFDRMWLRFNTKFIHNNVTDINQQCIFWNGARDHREIA